jgi:hypothetical protein
MSSFLQQLGIFTRGPYSSTTRRPGSRAPSTPCPCSRPNLDVTFRFESERVRVRQMGCLWRVGSRGLPSR